MAFNTPADRPEGNRNVVADELPDRRFFGFSAGIPPGAR